MGSITLITSLHVNGQRGNISACDELYNVDNISASDGLNNVGNIYACDVPRW